MDALPPTHAQDPGIKRPRSALFYREGQYPQIPHHFGAPASQWQQPLPGEGLDLTPYGNGAASQHASQKLSDTFQNLQLATNNDSYAYLGTSTYPGDLATTYHSEQQSERASFGPIKISGPKISLPNVRLPTSGELSDAWKVIKDVAIGVVTAPVTTPILVLIPPFLTALNNQFVDGRARNLPDWMITLLGVRYPSILMSNVRYAEKVSLPPPAAADAMTIGYKIHITRTIKVAQNTAITNVEESRAFAYDVKLLLHEIEHIVQYVHGFGDDFTWAAAYVFRTAVSFQIGKSKNENHDAIQMEKDAEAKAVSLIGYALDGFSRIQRTVPWASKPGPRVSINGDSSNVAMYATLAGLWLQSSNKMWDFFVQGDGNMVIYATGHHVAWQSETPGKAFPPYWLAPTPEHDQILFGGWQHIPRNGELETEPVTTFTTAKYLQPFYLAGSATSAVMLASRSVQSDSARSQYDMGDGRPRMYTSNITFLDSPSGHSSRVETYPSEYITPPTPSYECAWKHSCTADI